MCHNNPRFKSHDVVDVIENAKSNGVTNLDNATANGTGPVTLISKISRG